MENNDGKQKNLCEENSTDTVKNAAELLYDLIKDLIVTTTLSGPATCGRKRDLLVKKSFSFVRNNEIIIVGR